MSHHRLLEISGRVRFRASSDDIASLEAWLPIPPPPSYVELVETFGYGSTCCFFTIWVPTRRAPDECQLRFMSPVHKAELEEIAGRAHLGATEQLGSATLRRLIPFGTTDNGDYLTWDPSTRSPSGEVTIVVVGTKGSYGEVSVSDLWGFINHHTTHPDPEMRLPAVFVPFGEAVSLQTCELCGTRYASVHRCGRKDALARMVTARFARLVEDDAIQLSPSANVDALTSGVVRLVARRGDGAELAAWLLRQDDVDEVFVEDDVLDAWVAETWRELEVVWREA